MIIHAYFTDGFFDWAKFYLETLRYYNNLLYPVVFNTVGLTDGQQRELLSLYPSGLTILNERLNLSLFSQRANIPMERVAQYKKECECKFVDSTNRVWKLMTAGEDRVKALNNIMAQYHLHDFYVLHTDIDVYFRGSLSPLFREVSYCDIALRFRPKINPIKARMSIGLMGLRMNTKTFGFMGEWVRQIEKVPAQHRQIGYGQISCWEAYKNTRHDKIIWGNLPKAYGSHGKTKNNQKLWSGNIHNMGKREVLRWFRKDFEKRKKQEEGGI